MKDFLAFIKDNITLLDGATGTQFQLRGLPAGKSPELLNLEDPALVEEIHRAYVGAGSDVVYANTFGANRLKMPHGKTESIVRAGVEKARRAAGGKFVGLDIGPPGAHCEPLGGMTGDGG